MIKNTGVIIGQRDTDFVAGTLPYEARNESGDWEQYAPPGEWQGSAQGDSMSCVSYSALNSIEMQEKLLTGNQINYSDRWTAKMSGTTMEGNYLWKVADTIRELGLVLDSDYPTPSSFTFDQYHANIPEPLYSQLIEKGKKWLDKWSISYEWVPIDIASLKYHLKHAPLQVIIPGHAIVQIRNMNDVMRFYDTYQPYIKNLPQSKVTHALKIVLTSKSMSNTIFVHKAGSNEYGFYVPATSEDAIKDKALNYGVAIEKPDGSIEYSKAKEVTGL